MCEELLEPLQDTFGRIAIRSAYRSPTVNALGNQKGHNCASNESNFAGHIWDYPDKHGGVGATACIVIPWFADAVENGVDWRAMAYWIHNHLPYGSMQFFPKLSAFNINWHSQPERSIYSYIPPHKGYLLRGEEPNPEYATFYKGFPELAK